MDASPQPLRHEMTPRRSVAILGLLSGLMGINLEDAVQGDGSIIERVVERQLGLRREEMKLRTDGRRELGKILNSLKPKSGTGSCGVCGKTISANKTRCFAHIDVVWSEADEDAQKFEQARKNRELHGTVPLEEVLPSIKTAVRELAEATSGATQAMEGFKAVVDTIDIPFEHDMDGCDDPSCQACNGLPKGAA